MTSFITRKTPAGSVRILSWPKPTQDPKATAAAETGAVGIAAGDETKSVSGEGGR